MKLFKSVLIGLGLGTTTLSPLVLPAAASYTKPLQISQAYNRYSGSWSGNFQLDYGNPNSCSSRGQLQFTVDGRGTLRGILLASGEKMQFNGNVQPNGTFVVFGNEGTEARGNFYGNEFVGVYGNQTWSCSGRIGGRKF